MNRTASALSVILISSMCLADYIPPAQPLSHSLTPAQAAVAISSAPDSAVVSAPAWLLRGSGASTNALAAALSAVMLDRISDTRTNIPEAASLADAQIASLYLAQLTKDVQILLSYAPTSTVEYVIGAGIRLDLLNTNSTP